MTAKRAGRPTLSSPGEQVLALYERRLRAEEDLTAVTIRNYLSDLRHFAAWCESTWKQGREGRTFLLSRSRHYTNAHRLSNVPPIGALSSSQTRSIVA